MSLTTIRHLFAFFIFPITLFTLTVFSQGETAPGKRNIRPDVKPSIHAEPIKDNGIRYTYEFSQPDFVVSRIVIKHDDNGIGTITFEKRLSQEPITDPLLISETTLAQIKKAYDQADFLASKTEYQDDKHSFPNLGTSTLSLKSQGKERSVSLNWTQNKFIDSIVKDYRRISNQYVWMFDITLARDIQPLDAPKIVERLDSMMRRNEIADPPQMLPFLDEIKSDERLPLIARNHIAKITSQIRKKYKIK